VAALLVLLLDSKLVTTPITRRCGNLMTWADLHIVGDLLAARLLWTAITELVYKPLVIWKYNRLDAALGDHLPDLK
jgi:hypothetical protein